ncbi:ECF-type sigma factor [Rubinisphaera italica]|uniref:ECF sigma factor n=1 Tax=Rubinisphaera italica TaxID=2527969 RepID=A0A5C5XCX8_9PLAN|nr:ECF-type sigma factor [Rubinisphaera italica]TWT59772.1 ECF sigma factor [Rubinisphaera italica]
MSGPHSEADLTHWISTLKIGDSRATEIIWTAYFEKVVRLAQFKLKGFTMRVVDEEDVAIAVMNSLFRSVREGQIRRLSDRTDLWRILVLMTTHKVIDQIRHTHRERRGSGLVRGDSAFAGLDHNGQNGINQVIGEEPSPEIIVTLAEQKQQLIEQLGDERLKTIAIAKFDGYTNEELAANQQCSIRTIERKVRLIRSLWAQYLQNSSQQD